MSPVLIGFIKLWTNDSIVSIVSIVSVVIVTSAASTDDTTETDIAPIMS